jgi:hypothetical protein
MRSSPRQRLPSRPSLCGCSMSQLRRRRPRRRPRRGRPSRAGVSRAAGTRSDRHVGRCFAPLPHSSPRATARRTAIDRSWSRSRRGRFRSHGCTAMPSWTWRTPRQQRRLRPQARHERRLRTRVLPVARPSSAEQSRSLPGDISRTGPASIPNACCLAYLRPMSDAFEQIDAVYQSVGRDLFDRQDLHESARRT